MATEQHKAIMRAAVDAAKQHIYHVKQAWQHLANADAFADAVECIAGETDKWQMAGFMKQLDECHNEAVRRLESLEAEYTKRCTE